MPELGYFLVKTNSGTFLSQGGETFPQKEKDHQMAK
jgi:hypothetical protein